jgi:tRNA (cytidine/uridine-2'-O-)-methyltransferase
MNHIVCFEPRIPQNTGNIARTAAATNSALHLIRPFGFEITDRHLKRAGLDYWDAVDLHYHENLNDFLSGLAQTASIHLVTKFADKVYSEQNYENSHDHYFLFGREDTGLPEDFMRENKEKCIRIPQNDAHVRALNVSNCVALVIYEALRQQDFIRLERAHRYEKDKLK